MKVRPARKRAQPNLVLVKGSDAMTVKGMERIFFALTGKKFTREERILAQNKIDAYWANGR